MSFDIQFAESIPILDGEYLGRLASPFEDQCGAIARYHPAADIIEVGVVSASDMRRPQKENSIRKQIDVIPDPRAIGAR